MKLLGNFFMVMGEIPRSLIYSVSPFSKLYDMKILIFVNHLLFGVAY